MSDTSEMQPITPICNSPWFTPSPPINSNLPVPQPIPIPSNSHQTQFFSTNSPSPFNHNSPSFIEFSPCAIPTPSPQPYLNILPQPLPNPQPPPAADFGLQPEDDVSLLLANLQVNNSTQYSLIQSQAASIALLTAQARQDKKSIKTLQDETKNIKTVFHDELLKS
ncbi:hypothetical protein PTTG_28145 [Puccinia triticina 1-1 BBBD Race 1]|uniref:Uncharacterized protein n=1 Tax=Puccinia triticina (isolate 1-1 / race 1 (BBBD)) TaxID=630390 RepID=A0A180GG91_PUCT1|nr:hypothetical protein PTTG_28145 [Puccinia triticina 1-1 BBBD Race 1]